MLWVSFLRAINVGGRIVPMAELKKIFESLAFREVETFIASGNVIFREATAQTRRAQTLEAGIEKALRATLGYDVDTFLRNSREIRDVAEAKPFPSAVTEGAAATNVAFSKTTLSPGQIEQLAEFETGFDAFAAIGREIYWTCKVKQSESRFVSAKVERLLGVRVTWRNMNTVRRLSAKYPYTE